MAAMTDEELVKYQEKCRLEWQRAQIRLTIAERLMSFTPEERDHILHDRGPVTARALYVVSDE